MKEIKLSENEVNELVDLYQTEIDRARRRIENLQSILKKLTKETASKTRGKKAATKSTNTKGKTSAKKELEETVETAAEEVKKSDKKKRTTKSKAAPKKRGRKPKKTRKSIKKGNGEAKVKWVELIQTILAEKQNLLLASSLTLEAMTRLGIDEVERDRVRMAISTNLTKLTKYDGVLKKYTIEGQKGAFYGLSEWFNEDGTLKGDYKNRLM